MSRRVLSIHASKINSLATSAFFVLSVLLVACSTGVRLASETPSIPLHTIVFGSCAAQDGSQYFWDAIIAQQPQLFLFLGDNIYADTEDMAVMRAKYTRLAAEPGYRRLRERAQVLATWDDHDYGVNDGGAEYPMKAESQLSFMDFFAVPDTAPMRSRPGIYDAHIFGPEGRRVQVILLDARYFRGPLTRRPRGVRYAFPGHYVPSNDTTSSMLGETQWTWLEAQLRRPAEVRLLVSSVQVIAEEHGWEKWANLPHERARLFQLLRDTQAEGVILLSGDRHLAEISRLEGDLPDGIGYPLYDVTSSSLNRGGGGSDDEPNRHRIGPGNFRRSNFGKIAIDWTAGDPLISLQILDDAGAVRLRQAVRLSELRRHRG